MSYSLDVSSMVAALHFHPPPSTHTLPSTTLQPISSYLPLSLSPHPSLPALPLSLLPHSSLFPLYTPPSSLSHLSLPPCPSFISPPPFLSLPIYISPSIPALPLSLLPTSSLSPHLPPPHLPLSLISLSYVKKLSEVGRLCLETVQTFQRSMVHLNIVFVQSQVATLGGGGGGCREVGEEKEKRGRE